MPSTEAPALFDRALLEGVFTLTAHAASCGDDFPAGGLMLYLKPGVSLGELKPQTLLGAIIVAGVFERHGYDTTITSGNDGAHAGHPVAGESADPHYTGRALDFRFNAASLIPAEERPKVYEDVKRALGENFYTQLEGEGTDQSHIHAQYMGPA